jgi:hypothetical protein
LRTTICGVTVLTGRSCRFAGLSFVATAVRSGRSRHET